MAAATLKDLLNPLKKLDATNNATNESINNLTLVITGHANVANSLQGAILAQLQAQTELLKVLAIGKKGDGLAGMFSSGKEKGGLKKGADALGALGASAGELSKGLLMFALVPKGIHTKFIDFILTIDEVLEDINTKKIKQGGTALLSIGNGIFSFAKSIAASSVLLLTAVVGIPLLYASVIAVTPLFFALGMLSKPILRGAKTLDNIGEAITSFAIGLASFALATIFILIEPKILLGMVASITLISTAIGIIGTQSKFINRGALSIALMGLALIPFSIGYGFFALATSGVTIESAFMQLAILGAVGLGVTLIGKAGMAPIKGAISMGIMGIAFLPFAFGYSMFAEATKGMTIEDVGIQLAVIGGIGAAFAGAGFASPFIIAGALAIGASGAALLLLAPGLKAMKELQFTEDDSINLAFALSSVKASFLGGENAGEGFLSKIGGVITGAIDSVRMIESAAGFIAAGTALISLSAGLREFKKVDFTESDAQTMALTLSSVTAAFAQAGGEPASPGGLFGAIFGNAFSPNAVERGISSVMGAGAALKDVAQGLIEFQGLIDSKLDFDSVGSAIRKTLTFVGDAFGNIGGMEDANNAWFGLISWDENRVAKGIDAVKGAGKELTQIATGLKSFQELIDSEVNFETIGNAIKTTLTFVGDAFATIGGKETSDSWFVFSWDENAVAKGINAVKGAGAELTQIAQGLTSYQQLISDSSLSFEPDGNLAKAIRNSLTFVGDAFSMIGGKETTDSAWFGLIKWDENAVAKGIDAVKGAGTELKNIADGLKVISEIADPIAVGKTLSSLLTSVGNSFSSLYIENPDIDDKMSKVATFITAVGTQAKDGNLTKTAEGFQGISDAINSVDLEKSNSMGNLFKAAASLGTEAEAYMKLANAVAEIRDMLAAMPNTSETPISTPIGQAITNTEPNKETSLDLNKLNITLSKINATMANLPSAIASIEIKIPNEI